MRMLLKLIAILVVLGAIGLSGYAFLGDLSPEQETVTEPVLLNVD